MWTRARGLLAAPRFPDREKSRLAESLHPVLLAAMAVLLSNVFLSLVLAPSVRSLAINLAMCAVVVVAMAMVRRGWLQPAMVFLTVSFWLGLSFVAFVVVGMNSAVLSGYVAGAVLVGFFAGSRTVVAYSVCTAALLFGGAWADAHGLLPEPWGPTTPYMSWLSIAAGLAVTSILIHLSRANSRDAMEDLRRSERAAVEASRQLEASSALLETRARQQETVADLGQLALADTAPEELIEIAARRVGQTLAVDFVSIFEHSADGQEFVLRGGVGWPAAVIGSLTVPVDQATQAGHTLLANEPVIVADWHTEERFPIPIGFYEHGLRSSVSVVVHGTERPYGVFGVHAATCREFSHDDVHFLQSVANLITLVMRRKAMDRALSEREEDLRQAQKMEAIGRFAGGIAHDFNNVLTAISGYNEMLMNHLASDSPAYADAVEIDHAGRRAAALVQQILAFSRRQVLRLEVVDLNETIRKTKGMLERIIGADIALEIALDPELVNVQADPGQIEQVLLNLAANARDAMPRGGRLTIETSNATITDSSDEAAGPAPGEYARFVVRDTGVGMSEETRSQIFDPFFTTKGLSEGTGLGLSTVYGIVRQSGGNITVESKPGGGTAFLIDLPASKDLGRPAPASEVQSAVEHGNETVLLVEDEPGVRRLTRRMLEGLGYDVLEAENGRRALELVERREGTLPLVVTDVTMPELGGDGLVERLAAIHPEARVLYISGYTEHALPQDRLQPGRAAFLPKPFGQKDLADKLAMLLNGERGVGSGG